MNIAWGNLGLVLIVGLGAGAGAVALFAFGVTALAGREGPDGDIVLGSGAKATGYACFAVVAAIVLIGIYLAIPSLHKVF
jgi:hypothetical protein